MRNRESLMDARSLAILIPAAGLSRRLGGRDKLLEPVGGQPALTRAARLAVATGAQTMVTLAGDGPYSAGRRFALAGLGCTILPVRDAGEGISASLRAGARYAENLHVQGLMILLPDMPDVTAADLDQVIAAFALAPARVLRAANLKGVAGHPVILPARLLPELHLLSGDEGVEKILLGEPISLCPLPGDHALTDLDTAEDWASWRARTP